MRTTQGWSHALWACGFVVRSEVVNCCVDPSTKAIADPDINKIYSWHAPHAEMHFAKRCSRFICSRMLSRGFAWHHDGTNSAPADPSLHPTVQPRVRMHACWRRSGQRSAAQRSAAALPLWSARRYEENRAYLQFYGETQARRAVRRHSRRDGPLWPHCAECRRRRCKRCR